MSIIDCISSSSEVRPHSVSNKAKMNIFDNKIVVVTGATGALGSVVAEQFTRQGARVAAVARDPGKLSDLQKAIPGLKKAGFFIC